MPCQHSSAILVVHQPFLVEWIANSHWVLISVAFAVPLSPWWMSFVLALISVAVFGGALVFWHSATSSCLTDAGG
jgi:hypothetical protein